MFKLVFNDEFTKTYNKMKDRELQRRIFKRLEDLEQNPELGVMLSGIANELYGKLYRLRIGKYRVVYAINYETNEIHVLRVGPRENVYDRMQ
jgi:mRNA-degrading endonuclease RelE of RelBE toxin-antitoxin system